MNDIACSSLGVLCGANGATFLLFVATVVACAVEYLRREL